MRLQSRKEKMITLPQAKNSKVLTKIGHFCLIFDQDPRSSSSKYEFIWKSNAILEFHSFLPDARILNGVMVVQSLTWLGGLPGLISP